MRSWSVAHEGGVIGMLRQLREAALLTQEELAAKLGVPYQRVGEWERGEKAPRPSNQRKLCEALGVSPAELLAALAATRGAAGKVEAAA